MGPALRAERGAQHLLGRGLADRAGDGDDAAAEPRARRAAQGVERRPARRARSAAARPAPRPRAMRDTSAAAAPAASASATKSWPSRASVSATNRSPGARVRVSIDTPLAAQSRGPRRRWPPPPRRGSRAGRGRASSCASPSSAATRRSPARRRRRDSTSSPIVWPVSWPLPAISSASPGCSASTARQDRLGAVADLVRAGAAAARIAARIAAGSSRARVVVGDEQPRRRASAAAAPISGRLPGSRSPPAPNTTTRRPMTCGRSAASAVASASGVWA